MTQLHKIFDSFIRSNHLSKQFNDFVELYELDLVEANLQDEDKAAKIREDEAVEFLQWVSDSNWQFDKVSLDGDYYFSDRSGTENKYCDTTRELYALFLTQRTNPIGSPSI